MDNDIINTTEKLLFRVDGMGFVGRTVSNEGIIDTIKSLVGTFSTQLASVKNVFTTNKERAKNLKLDKRDMNVFTRELIKLRPQVQDIIQTFDYSDIMEYKIPTLAKLDKNFLDASKDLSNIYKNMDVKLEHYLNNLDTTVSNIVGDEGYRTSSRPVKPDLEAKEYSVELRDKLAKLLKSKKMDDMDKVKNVYPNMKSILDTFDILVSLSNSTSINNIESLKNYCDDIESKLNIFLMDIKDNNVEISKHILIKLSEDLESVANIITLVVSFIEVYSRLVLIVKKHIEIIPTFSEYLKS